MQLLQSFIHNSGEKKQSTWDSEDVTTEISRRNKDGPFSCLGMHAAKQNCEIQHPTEFPLDKISHMREHSYPNYFSSDIKIIHVSEFFMIFSVFF